MANPVNCDVNLRVGTIKDPQVILNEVVSKSSSIFTDIDLIKQEAEALTEEARGLISQAGSFAPRSPKDVFFKPTVGAFSYGSVPIPAAPVLFRPSDLGDMDGIGRPPSIQIDGFEVSTLNPPSLSPVSFDQTPVEFVSIGTPQAPADAQIDIPAAPDIDINIDLSALPDEGPAPVFAGTGDVISPLLDIAPYTPSALTLPDESDFDRYESLVNREFEFPEYHQKMLPTLMPAVGALLAHDGFVVDTDDLLDNSQQQISEQVTRHFNKRQRSLWDRRGMAADAARDAAVQAQTSQVIQRYQAYDQQELEVQMIRWRMKLLPVALQLTTEAHSLMMEILGELYDLEFEFLAAKQMALIGLFDLAVSKYNQNLIKLQREAALYRGLSAQARSRASQYGIFTQQQQYRANLNQALGSAYEAEHRVMAMKADIFRTEASLAEISLDAYSAWVQGVTTKAQAARAQFANYEAQLAKWSGDVQEVSNQHKINRLQNREVIERNRALSAQLSSDATAEAAVSYAAVQSAAEVRAQVAHARAVLANRTGDNERTAYNNAEQAALYGMSIDDYKISTADYSIKTMPDRTVFGAQETINSRTTTLYSEIAQTAVRAAELTQQYRTKLSDAYLAIYEATGRADAARVSGELSKYRASLGLQASGNIGHSSQLSRRTSENESLGQQESSSCTTSYSYTQKAEE